MVTSKSVPGPGTEKICQPYEARMLKSTVVFLVLCFIWSASFVLIDKARLHGWLPSGSFAITCVALNTLLGVGVIVAFIKHLAAMDELQQKIQLVAMGFALGVTLVGAFTYTLLVTIGVVTDAETKDIILLLAGSYIAAVLIGQVRYR